MRYRKFTVTAVLVTGVTGCALQDSEDLQFQASELAQTQDQILDESEDLAQLEHRQQQKSVHSVQTAPADLQAISVYGGCWLYKDHSYGGVPMFIPQGHDYNDLHRINGFGDAVTSLKCDAGATVWSGSNFTGAAYAVSGDIINLPNSGPTGPYNDTISSISWGDTGTGHCTFFIDSNYGGTSSLLVVSGRDYNDLHRTSPSFGDNISSVACAGLNGTTPKLCKNDTWGGTCFGLAGDFYPNLGSIGYGDNVSSIRWF